MHLGIVFFHFWKKLSYCHKILYEQLHVCLNPNYWIVYNNPDRQTPFWTIIWMDGRHNSLPTYIIKNQISTKHFLAPNQQMSPMVQVWRLKLRSSPYWKTWSGQLTLMGVRNLIFGGVDTTTEFDKLLIYSKVWFENWACNMTSTTIE